MIHEARIQLQPIDARGELYRIAHLVLIVAILLFTPSVSTRAEEFVFRHDNILGTSMDLRVDSLSRKDAEQAEHAALDEIDRLNGILSSYDPESIFSKFSEFPLNIPIYLPTELLELFVASDWWKSKTNGAFNPLIQESVLLWKESARAGMLPNPLAVAKSLESSSQSAWEVDPGFKSAWEVDPGFKSAIRTNGSLSPLKGVSATKTDLAFFSHRSLRSRVPSYVRK